MTTDYDRIYGQLTDLAPMSRPTTIREALPILGNVTTWVVQTALHDGGAVTFIEAMSADGQIRIVLPSKVTAAIVRQDRTLREKAADRRSAARRQRDADRAKVQAARNLLARKREERRARREQTG